MEGDVDVTDGVDADVPAAGAVRNGDVAELTLDNAAVPVTNPAEFGEEDTVVPLVEVDFLSIRVAEGIPPPLLLEARRMTTLFEEVAVRSLEVLEGLLERMDGRVFQPRCINAVAPLREFLAQPGVGQLLLARLMAGLLQCETSVVDEPARPCEATEVAFLHTVRSEGELVGLVPLHNLTIRSFPTRPHL